MELEIVGKRENPLLKRTEVQFRVAHPNEQTPKRGDLRQQLALALHATRDIVIVDHLKSEFGRSASHGYAKVYKSKEDALKVERKHILVRNGLIAAEVKEKKEAPPKPAKVPRKEAAPKAAEPAAAKEEGVPEKKEAKAPAEKKGEKPSAGKEEAKPAAKKEEKKPEAKKGGKEGK